MNLLLAIAIGGTYLFSLARTIKSIADEINLNSQKERKMLMLKITGKVAIVTGAAGGIGLGTAETLLQKGAFVVMSDINEKLLTKESARLTNLYPMQVVQKVTDVTNEKEVEELVQYAVNIFGHLDIMVANAGLLITGSHLDETEKFAKMVDVNLWGVYFCDKYAIKAMKEQNKKGVVINISSAAGIKGQNGYPLYSMTKFGVRGLTKALAAEFVKDGIRVNSIHPAGVQTPMTTAGMTEEQIAIMLEQCKHVQPLGFAQPEEIAHGIVYAIENEQLTGQEIVIDGGYLL